MKAQSGDAAPSTRIFDLQFRIARGRAQSRLRTFRVTLASGNSLAVTSPNSALSKRTGEVADLSKAYPIYWSDLQRGN